MENRYVFKVAGAAGQGIKTAGLVIAKSLKRAGYYTFGYTEYPSLIRGGHNVFQIDVSTDPIYSPSQKLNLLLALNEESIALHVDELDEKSVVIYDSGAFTIKEAVKSALDAKSAQSYGIPLLTLAKGTGGTAIMKNTVSLGSVWKILGLDLSILQTVIAELFNKSEEIIELNKKCAQIGYDNTKPEDDHKLFKDCIGCNTNDLDNDLIIAGNEALALGAIAGGVRLYSSYPMTPASSILTFLAEEGTKYGMVVKQAEDEITAVNMVVGANHGGTRALCATSGGGFDLMTEAISLAGITETPLPIVLGQRPGPATGVPTWTAQGDLNLALYGGHGEYPRFVVAPGDTTEAFQLIQVLLNTSEQLQIPAILLTDKLLGESFYTTPSFSESIPINRGELIPDEDCEKYAEELRYKFTETGISPRWLPGSKGATYLTNSDEHTPKGYSTEDANEIKAMVEKRAKKYATLADMIPEANIFGASEDIDIAILAWGSTKGVLMDLLSLTDQRICVIHYNFIWPLKTQRALDMINKAKYAFSVEGNLDSQFTKIFEAESGIKILDKMTKYDGRPIYIEELLEKISQISDNQNG
ncbi:MAG: 2-oxoacid:acceptor oxidoreductase subunit alpha [Candidatus Dojkabacteria bacterium]|uniref:2-oxoglutarate oxidoreductase subunit KorA n=2 Tax=Candidatus Dojkabacteria TaxID=74243 RepID=A0A136KJ54_9BACT|nr:MAG: 2-oxoglutarate oxidoreductase subunit KorA [candidate division WS6 bacterium OLB21]MBW7953897.1 2-oxoacid:acceptor oxidoreductase subunit alpha [Candidatus Dojkabacteria bacterium]WKZ28264.1 MAG: 2-oxoacid:acceptor oxidoreductase subunit alpha [Candidatus Dojkabacteria bacterium]